MGLKRWLLTGIICLSLCSCSWIEQEGQRQTSIQPIAQEGWRSEDIVKLHYVSLPKTRMYEVELLCRLDTRERSGVLSLELTWRRGLSWIATDTLTLDAKQALKGRRTREMWQGEDATRIVRGVYHSDINQMVPHLVELSPAGLYTLEVRLLSPKRSEGVVAIGARISPKQRLQSIPE